MKDEQRRKFDLLYQNYEDALQTMLDNDNVGLSMFDYFSIGCHR
jgi:hypothetical protein